MPSAGPALAGTGPTKRPRRGAPLNRWCYDVLVASQSCYDLFGTEYVSKMAYMNINKTSIIGVDMYVHDNTTVSFIWRGVGTDYVFLC